MNEEVYSYLINFNFTKEQVNYIEDNNEKIFYLNLFHLRFIIDELQKYGLSNEEIIKISLDNVYLFTTTIERFKNIDDLFNNYFNLDLNDIKYIITNNPNIYLENENSIKTKCGKSKELLLTISKNKNVT